MAIDELEILLSKPFSCNEWVKYKTAYYHYYKNSPNCNCSCSGMAVYNQLKSKSNQLKEDMAKKKIEPIVTPVITNTATDNVIELAKKSIFSGYNDVELITKAYKKITNSEQPMNILYMRKAILNH